MRQNHRVVEEDSPQHPLFHHTRFCRDHRHHGSLDRCDASSLPAASGFLRAPHTEHGLQPPLHPPPPPPEPPPFPARRYHVPRAARRSDPPAAAGGLRGSRPPRRRGVGDGRLAESARPVAAVAAGVSGGLRGRTSVVTSRVDAAAGDSPSAERGAGGRAAAGGHAATLLPALLSRVRRVADDRRAGAAAVGAKAGYSVGVCWRSRDRRWCRCCRRRCRRCCRC